MLGERFGENDIAIYLEEDEIQRLAYEIILGDFLSLNNGIFFGSIEGKVVSELSGAIVDLKLRKNDLGKYIEKASFCIRTDTYKDFLNHGNILDHQGNRHIHLIDVNRIDFEFKSSYWALKHYQSQRK